MSGLTDLVKHIAPAAPLLSFIPGIGPLLGAGLTAAGGLVDAGEKQKAAQNTLNTQNQQMQMLMPYYQNALKSAFDPNQSPYPAAGPYDPYSPSLNEAQLQGYKDSGAKQLQATLASMDANLRPTGGMGSSAQIYAKGQALRDSLSSNVAFQRNLIIQGGLERYKNAVDASNEKFRRQAMLLGSGGALAGQSANLYGEQQGAANSAVGGLADSIKAVLSAGGLGAGKGANRGNSTLATNQTKPAPTWTPPVTTTGTDAGTGIGDAISGALGRIPSFSGSF